MAGISEAHSKERNVLELKVSIIYFIMREIKTKDLLAPQKNIVTEMPSTYTYMYR